MGLATIRRQGLPRLIIQVRWGPCAYKKVVLEPGETLRVGRAEDEGLSFRYKTLTLAHDTQLSDIHFELSWDGRSCRMLDLKSATGTQVGGLRVDESELFHGGWVRAGGTDFSVYVEAATPPREPSTPDPPGLEAARALALERLKCAEAPLFAVLDASQDRRVLELLQESVNEYRSLYKGVQGESLADVAPYLVALPKGSRLLESLMREGWGRNWGVYLESQAGFLEVRRQLRKSLMVEAEGVSGRLYFRFYDPRVLRTFLPTCDSTQREEFFGDVTCFAVEWDDGTMLRFPSREGGELKQSEEMHGKGIDST